MSRNYLDIVGDERAKNDTVDLEQPDDINYEEFCEEWLSEFLNWTLSSLEKG